LERGLAPFLGCRRWRNYLRVQGSIPRFEPGSAGPEPAMLGHYTTGL